MSKIYDYHKMVEQVEKKHNICVCDFCKWKEDKERRDIQWKSWVTKKFNKTFSELEKELGKSCYDWPAEYWNTPFPDPRVDRVPYIDFWHWMLDYWNKDISNGCVKKINWHKVALYAAEETKKDITKAYMMLIASYFYLEFVNKTYTVKIEW